VGLEELPSLVADAVELVREIVPLALRREWYFVGGFVADALPKLKWKIGVSVEIPRCSGCVLLLRSIGNVNHRIYSQHQGNESDDETEPGRNICAKEHENTSHNSEGEYAQLHVSDVTISDIERDEGKENSCDDSWADH
jgi:hypothetical protein